ncbi:MAG: T9SS type A sorting domain-containing protein, partial [Candidatus Goldiibacteriota bacterium]
SPSAVETATQTVSFSATETRTLIIINTATATPTKTPDTGAAVPEAGEGAPYPNPGKTGLNTHIFYSIETSGEITVEVYTVDGRKILTDNKGIFSGRGKITVDVSDLGPGVYFVRYRMVPEDAAPAKEKISRFLIKRH